MRASTLLERLIPTPRLREVDHADLAAPPSSVWKVVRHANLARTPLMRALLEVHAPLRSGKRLETRLSVDDFRSTTERPGFQVLADEPPWGFTVGAIARVHGVRLSIIDVQGADAFAKFMDPGFVKLAWSVSIAPHGAEHSRLHFEVRISATDAKAWRASRLYFALIGPGMHLVVRRVLGALADEFGWPARRSQPVILSA